MKGPALLALAALTAASTVACDSRDVSLGDGRSSPLAPEDGGRSEEGGPRPDAASTPSFGVPVLVQGIGAADAGEATDDDPSLTADLLEMAFNSRREGGAGREDIYITTRSSPSSSWNPPASVDVLSSPSRETGISLTADGLVLYFSSDREGGQGGLDVYVAKRASRGEAWSAPELVPELASEGDDLVSAVDPAGDTLYLARRDGEDDDYDLFVAVRDGDSFAAPLAVAELNTDDEQSDAFPARGGLALVFTQDEDLVFTERARVTDPFGVALDVPALNSDGDDRDAWATPDLSYVVFSSDRSGAYRLYEARAGR